VLIGDSIHVKKRIPSDADIGFETYHRNMKCKKANEVLYSD